MLYTLYYQTEYRRPVAVATSDSLIRLLKIQKMTFHHTGVFSYITETLKVGDSDAFLYGADCISSNEYADFVKFVDAVDGGKYFKSYDYKQRVRGHYLKTL